MELMPPSVDYKDSFIDAVRESQVLGTDELAGRRYRELSIAELEADFESFVQHELSHSRGENLPAGYVPATEYWLVDGGEYIGHIGIRHTLSEHLLRIGGHIGYSIRPSKRRRGYGNNILALALPKAKELGIEKVLLTCDTDNEASRKIIEKNGGVLEDAIPNPETGVDKLRYWIDIK